MYATQMRHIATQREENQDGTCFEHSDIIDTNNIYNEMITPGTN